MHQLDPLARVLFGHNAYKMISTAAGAVGSAPATGSQALTVDGILTGGASGFLSTQTGAACNGVSNIGQNFGRYVEVRRLDYWSYDAPGNYDSLSNKLQYSFDGTTWVDHSILAMAAYGSPNPQIFFIERKLKAPQWRLLCNATPNPGGNRWGAAELLMYALT